MTSLSAIARAVAPRANASFVAALDRDGPDILNRYGWTSQTAIAQLMAQMAHESGGLRSFAENLMYSAARLVAVWPARFPSVALAAPYAGHPEKLANKVYANRIGNGPESSGDGFKYRGSGGLQHTGKAEFARVERRTNLTVVEHPDALRDPAQASVMLAAAVTFMVDRGLKAAAERGDTEACTRGINGGTIGLADRRILAQRAEAAARGLALPAARTTVEQRDTAASQARRVGAAAGAGAGATTVATQAPPAPQTVPPHVAAIIGGAFVLACAVVAGVLVARWLKARGAAQTQQLEALKARAEAPSPPPAAPLPPLPAAA